MIGRFGPILLVVLGLGAVPVQGAPLTFSFAGTIDYVAEDLGLDTSVIAGVPFSGSYTFDPSTVPDSNPGDQRVGSYRFGNSAQLLIEIGNYTFITNDLVIFILNDANGEDLYEVGNASPFFAAGYQWSLMALLLRDFTATAFDSDALPITPPDLDDFGFETSIGLVRAGHEPSITGVLTSLTPEPSSLGREKGVRLTS